MFPVKNATLFINGKACNFFHHSSNGVSIYIPNSKEFDGNSVFHLHDISKDFAKRVIQATGDERGPLAMAEDIDDLHSLMQAIAFH